MKSPFRIAATGLVPAAFLLAIGVAGGAGAHAIVTESKPTVRDHVPAGAQAITVHFNSRIDPKRSKLVLIAADRSESPVTLTTAADDQTLVGSVTAAPGEYRLRWQVLAIDGHITRGDIPFTVDAP